MSVTIKVHNVLHNPWNGDLKPTTVENRIESNIIRHDVLNVRVAKGWQNSPVYVEVDQRAISVKSMQEIARAVAQEMKQCIGGVEMDWATREKNIKIVS